MEKSSLKIFRKYFLAILLVVIVICAIWGYLNYRDQKEQKLNAVQTEMAKVTEIGTATLPGDSVSEIDEAGDFNSPEYNLVHSKLVYLKKVTQVESDAIRILRPKGNLTEILMDATDQNLIGSNFDLWQKMTETFRQTKITQEISENDEGLILTTFGPITDSAQKVVAILMIQNTLKTGFGDLLAALATPLIFGLILLVFAVLIMFLQMRNLSTGIHLVDQNIERLLASKPVMSTGEDELLGELLPKLKQIQERFQTRKESDEDRDKIQKQIKELLRTVNAAANGDFTVIASVTADTLGALSDSFNLMISDLSGLIRDVKKAAEQTVSSATDILKTTEAMAKGSVDQASQTENISNLAKEMAELITNTNKSAQTAADAAQSAKEMAERGSDIVKQSTEGMQRIRDSVRKASRQVKLLGDNSLKIGEITDFISDIANRTNMLALNASIEAARAGEAGRGFTVVADEIRKLAERVSRSAEEISELIDDIQTGTSEAIKVMDSGTQEVQEGTKLVDGAGGALKEILGSVEISTSSAIEISDTMKNQAKFSQDIAASLEHIAGIAKETANGAQQSKNSASNLEDLSKKLNQAVEKFRLAE